MFDKSGIYERFVACYAVAGIAELAAALGIKYQTIHGWKTGKYPIPWIRLKALVNEQNLSWDWLLEGKKPKHRSDDRKVSRKSFDRKGINKRFLSLYPGYSNAKLGKELGINGTTVFKWRHDMEQVAWERLKHAVDNRGVTWDWLIEGL